MIKTWTVGVLRKVGKKKPYTYILNCCGKEIYDKGTKSNQDKKEKKSTGSILGKIRKTARQTISDLDTQTMKSFSKEG
jgi:hypothetical protein